MVRIEKLSADAEFFGRGDVARAVVDKERLRRVEPVAFEQDAVYLRFGLHRMFFARNHFAVEKPVDREAA